MLETVWDWCLIVFAVVVWLGVVLTVRQNRPGC